MQITFPPSFTDEVVRNYEALQGDIQDRLNALNSALGQSQDVKENLDELLRWLQQAENKSRLMDQGTMVQVKRDPLMDNYEQYMVSRGEPPIYHWPLIMFDAAR